MKKGDKRETKERREMMMDQFLFKHNPAELKVAAEFLTNWLPFLTLNLCYNCSQTLSNRVFSLDPDFSGEAQQLPLKAGSPTTQADTEEDGFEEGGNTGEQEASKHILSTAPGKNIGKKVSSLSREQREYFRFKMVKRKKDFVFMGRVRGTNVNILDGLELHTGVFSGAEQKRIVDFIYSLETMGRKGELKERTFSAPEKWMPGKGRVTIQFGCCYNYAVLKDGSPPGILRDTHVDPIPDLFKVMIRRLVGWHILPPHCVPDSCIVNIYEEGDCIPPHIDHHDFLRPFCSVSFLSECNILFGTSLRTIGPGEFSGAIAIPLPVGSVLVLKGNGADVAKHCVPAVPTKRISITFRKMDETKLPTWFVPEPDLQGLQRLPYDVYKSNLPESSPQINKQPPMRLVNSEERSTRFSSRGSRSEARHMVPTEGLQYDDEPESNNRQAVTRDAEPEKQRGFHVRPFGTGWTSRTRARGPE